MTSRYASKQLSCSIDSETGHWSSVMRMVLDSVPPFVVHVDATRTVRVTREGNRGTTLFLGVPDLVVAVAPWAWVARINRPAQRHVIADLSPADMSPGTAPPSASKHRRCLRTRDWRPFRIPRHEFRVKQPPSQPLPPVGQPFHR